MNQDLLTKLRQIQTEIPWTSPDDLRALFRRLVEAIIEDLEQAEIEENKS